MHFKICVDVILCSTMVRVLDPIPNFFALVSEVGIISGIDALENVGSTMYDGDKALMERHKTKQFFRISQCRSRTFTRTRS